MVYARSSMRFLIGMVVLLALVACASGESSRSTGTYVDDKVIGTKVKAQLAADEVTKAYQINVETYQGVVQLNGFVDKKAAVSRATEVAQSVEGVQKVVNNLQVR